jgi:taurine dioxygenase
MTVQIRFTDKPLGHEIVGVDLSHPVPDEDFAAVEEAYDRYGVVVFRGQQLSPDAQIAASRRFGPIEPFVMARYNLKTHPEIFVVSNVIENGEPIGLGDAGRYWHTDMWVNPVPPRGSMLYAMEVPHDDAGQPLGDTCFASTAAAYDALPAALRQTIEHRQALYSAQKFVDFRIKHTSGAGPGGELTAAERESMAERTKNIVPEITHPLVKRHPRTGRKCIYFSEGAISHVVGLPDDESEQVLRELREHLLKPEFVYRHRWQVGDAVMWDNVSCIHKAINDYAWPQRRRMHRTTLAHHPKASVQ